MSEKEKRIRSITKIYYSNPEIQKAIFSFAENREVVPRYYEGFGKRPDTLQYPSDVMGLVNKGATSFHASEEIWDNPLNINSDLTQKELSELRTGWDLLIDIDSHFFDYSKIAARLIAEELENQGIKNYRIKFSGKKGFHLIVPANAFPKKFLELETKEMFPEWPRAILGYINHKIKRKYNEEVSKISIDYDALKERTKMSKEDVTTTVCPSCGGESKKGNLVSFACSRCKTSVERKNYKKTKRKMRCISEDCPGFFEIIDEKEFFFCEDCGTSSRDSKHLSDKKVTYTRDSNFSRNYSSDFKEEISGEKMAELDLVLVSSRHLFRMPYSLHEGTALASVVLTKEQINSFSPTDASPLKVKVSDFYPTAKEGEASKLLESAISWKKFHDAEEESITKKKYSSGKIEVTGVTEEMFPKPIKKLLKGLVDGRKRGLFVILTFLKCLNFSPEYIHKKVSDWNKLNEQPLKEGYIRSQIDWHLKQTKQILPPNYKNDSYYKDLNLIEDYPKAKNPIVEVLKKARKNNSTNLYK